MTHGGGGKPRAVAVAALGCLSLLVSLLSCSAAAAQSTTTSTSPQLSPMSGSYVFSVVFDGQTRSYRLHVPPPRPPTVSPCR